VRAKRSELHQVRHLTDVLVAAAGEIDDDELVLGQAGAAFEERGDGVGAFEGGNDPFEPRELLNAFSAWSSVA